MFAFILYAQVPLPGSTCQQEVARPRGMSPHCIPQRILGVEFLTEFLPLGLIIKGKGAGVQINDRLPGSGVAAQHKDLVSVPSGFPHPECTSGRTSEGGPK